MSINPQEVSDAFRSCLFEQSELKDGKPPEDAVIVHGLTVNVGFHPGRLESVRPKVLEWIDSLPENFLAEKGGGWSFLNLCEDKDGNQWTGLHQTQQELLLLAIGLGHASIQVPRELWGAFPGGMPYVVFSKEKDVTIRCVLPNEAT